MSLRKAALPALVLAAALVGAADYGAFTAPSADAQAAAGTAEARPEHHFDPTRHIEGRIAFLKAELKITDSQAPLFERVAQAMRDNAKAMRDAYERRRGDRDKPRTAVESLQARVSAGQSRIEQTQRFLAAFTPLYDSLSDEQKKTADELLAGHRHHRRH